MINISRIGSFHIWPNQTRVRHIDKISEIKKEHIFDDTIKTTHHLIDCSKTPFIGTGVYLDKQYHKILFEWNPEKVYLLNGSFKNIHDAFHEFRKESVLLNANVLDYLLAHTWLIPNKWRHILVFFCGTIYGCHNHLFVRCLNYDAINDIWYAHLIPFYGKWNDECMFIISTVK